MSTFEINFLDHVAVRVKDIEASTRWYVDVLGLKRYDVSEWNGYPVFLMKGKTGLALFTADTNDPELVRDSRNVKIDHFAFNVSKIDFQKAREHYEQLGLVYSFQDHIHFHSIYTEDPDGHTVELTTQINEDFFKE